MDTANRLCHQCGKPLKGRIDKKFCDDYCRNNYNNRIQNDSGSFVRQVNQLLKKNRHILEDLLKEEKMVKIDSRLLMEKGYLLQYQTHQYITQKGDVYHFCYEYGLLALEKNQFLLVKKKALFDKATPFSTTKNPS